MIDRLTSSPVRVLELRSTYRGGGGPDKTILLSAAAHDPTRVQVTCVYLRGADDAAFTLHERARELQVPFEAILERGGMDPTLLPRLAHTLYRHRPHIIHTHDYKSDLLGWALRPLVPRARLLATAHGWTLDNRRMNIYNQLDRLVLRRFDHVIAVSGATRERMVRAGIPDRRITLLYNGIDLNVWRPPGGEVDRISVRRALGLPVDGPLVGFIGRLSPEKQVSVALEAVRLARERHPGLHLVVVGDGAAESDLPGMVRRKGLEGVVHALGYRRVTPEWYHALDVYLMSSRTEGLPNTLLEAMACGCPSVVTAVGGIPELVGSSGGVLLCPSGDAACLARGVSVVVEEPGRGVRMGEAARRRVEEAFSFEARLRAIEGLYESLARGRGVRRWW